MTLATVDATLSRFTAAIDTMTANLVDLESNPTNKLLDPAGLVGTSKTRIAAARQTLDAVWGYFTEFKALVERARALRGPGGHIPLARVQELEALLNGQSISLPPIDIPLAKRGLLTPAQTNVTASPGELLTYMEGAFAAAKGEVLAVDDVWRTLVPRLGQAEHAIAELSALAQSLGEAADPSLLGARATVTDLGRVITNDPLGAHPDQLDTVEMMLGALRSRLEKLVSQRDDLQHNLDRATALLGELMTTIDAGQQALTDARAKVLDPQGLLAPVGRDCLTDERRGLDPWLGRLKRIAAQGNWRSACRGLDEWSSVASQTLATARTVAAANAAPVQLRDELRGRLDGFTAKAERLGLTEDPTLAAMAAQARALLYTAPSDVSAAAELIGRYGAALNPGAVGQR